MTESTYSIDELVQILTTCGLKPTEHLTLPGRAATYAPVPTNLAPALYEHLTASFPSGLYSHQAVAIEAGVSGQDICLATPTASGKSLVFMSIAAQAVLKDRFAKVLALYPAKALIQDQLEKWGAFLKPFGARVGFIDGSVPVAARAKILALNRVVAMTPDVAHAWLMSHIAENDVAHFLKHLGLVVMDEAHVYDGAFGSNMAYFLRRLCAVAKPFRMVCSTATVGEAESFMQQLTGRSVTVFGAETDGSAVAEKTLLLTPVNAKGNFDKAVQLLANLAAHGNVRFLAFGDSRKAVERLVAATLRHSKEAAAEEASVDDDTADQDEDVAGEDLQAWPALEQVLPYRAGYETQDRDDIQRALTRGTLAGVVSTSALELGLDIGDLDVVILLNTPPSIKAFRQRVGRAGRKRAAVCILLDDANAMSPLTAYLAKTPEPSWMYLENRYIQYANALCAAAELQGKGEPRVPLACYAGLPSTFGRLVENELNPTEAVPPDLYGLKQKAQSNPHYEFPIRSAAEPNFEVEGPFGKKLGTLSYAQALREAYPGAVYYYMARPFRAYMLEFKASKIRAKRSKFFTTKPLTDNLAFPDFAKGMLNAWRSDAGFVCEVELQVSERVKGFTEQRGSKKFAHEYGPTSEFSQKPLTRFFRTTGVCWAFPGIVDRSDAVTEALLNAFAVFGGIQPRDLGNASFKANQGPFGPAPIAGSVIFDATNGSLRLTERLGQTFQAVIARALEHAEGRLREQLEALHEAALALQPHHLSAELEQPTGVSDGWVDVIAPGEKAMYLHQADGPLEVTVIKYTYTPNGIMYELGPLSHASAVPVPGSPAPMKWKVLASHIQPVHGITKLVRYNVVTGDEQEVVSA